MSICVVLIFDNGACMYIGANKYVFNFFTSVAQRFALWVFDGEVASSISSRTNLGNELINIVFGSESLGSAWSSVAQYREFPMVKRGNCYDCMAHNYYY